MRPIDGDGPYNDNTQPLDDGIRTVVFVGSLDMSTSCYIYSRYVIANAVTGTLFDFRIHPGALTRTQIYDYHHKMMAAIGAQV